MAETLAQVRASIRRDRKIIEAAQARMPEKIRHAIELGGAAPDVAADAGISVSRVGQIVGGVRKVRQAAGVTAPKRRRPAKTDDDAALEGTADCDGGCAPAPTDGDAVAAVLPQADDRFRVGAVGRVHQLVHARGLVTDRWDKPRDERPTIFLDVATGSWWTAAGASGRIEWRAQSAAEVLAGLPASVERVYVCGPHRPGVTPETVRRYGDGAKAARAWFLADVPEGWAGHHFLADDAALVGRWTHTDGRTVEVQHAAVWFGHGAYGARDAAYAWHVLRRDVRAAFGPHAALMSTPSTTGRDLWRRTIPKGRSFPVLSAELRQLIQSTSGQGRREVVAHEPGEVGMVTQYDMRFAYAALTWGMPVGVPEMVTRTTWDAMDDETQGRTLARRGRWLVRATVPGGWDHVGILPHLSADGWVWPSRPGTSFTSWCSAWEVACARKNGWRVDVLEGLHFNEGKPLNVWRDQLMTIWGKDREGVTPLITGMVRDAVRAMLLGTLGAFASRSRMVTRTAAEGQELPANAPIREVAGRYVWEEQGERSEWTERTDHPEWAAEVWGRCRHRLLESPAVDGVRTGALHVPPGTVIGLRTDGLTLVGDPEWPDDGAVGRFRLTGRARGAFGWPQTDGALSELKRVAEGAYQTGEMQ